jgi:gliding motility-associated-like protein
VARDEITIRVICKNTNVFIPNTFSPNRDGMNDIFFPRGTGLFNIKSFRVFNRWGQLIFERYNVAPNTESQGWNGTYNGKNVQTDVYVYMMEVVCENGSIIPIKGNITLLR